MGIHVEEGLLARSAEHRGINTVNSQFPFSPRCLSPLPHRADAEEHRLRRLLVYQHQGVSLASH